MSRLEEIAERDGWRCWLCDEPVDPGASSNDDRGASIDAVVTKAKAKRSGPAEERLAHRACNTKKGANEAVVHWPAHLFVVPEGEVHRAARLGPRRQQVLDRLEDPDQASLVVERTPPPHIPGRDPALAFRALGDATRFAMAGLLARRPMSSAELGRQLGLSKPTVTHHVHLLRQAGLLSEQTDGKAVILSLDRASIEDLSSATVMQLFDGGEAPPLARSRRPS